MYASEEEIAYLKKRWEELSKGDEPHFYHVSGFSHPKLAALISENGKLDINKFTWGLIPHWVKNKLQAREIWNKTLNVRGETIFEKPSFRDAAKSSRVIIPLEGFFEHHHKAGKTFPYFIKRKDGKRMLVGGLASDWVNVTTGEVEKTLSIVTTKGNAMMSEIHNNPKLKEPRMPLILSDEDTAQWLEGEENDAQALIEPNVDVEFESQTVRRLSGKNSVGNCEEAQEEYLYDELIEPPTLF